MDREVSDDVIMTSWNGVCHWSHVIIDIKFGDDRMRNDQVIIQISQKWAIFRRNQWPCRIWHPFCSRDDIPFVVNCGISESKHEWYCIYTTNGTSRFFQKGCLKIFCPQKVCWNFLKRDVKMSENTNVWNLLQKGSKISKNKLQMGPLSQKVCKKLLQMGCLKNKKLTSKFWKWLCLHSGWLIYML